MYTKQRHPSYSRQVSQLTYTSVPSSTLGYSTTRSQAPSVKAVVRRQSRLDRIITSVLLLLFLVLGLYATIYVYNDEIDSTIFRSNFELAFRSNENNLQASFMSYLFYPFIYIWNLIWMLWLVLDECFLLKKILCVSFPIIFGKLVQVEFIFGCLFMALTIQLIDAGQIYAKFWAATMTFISFGLAFMALTIKLEKYRAFMLQNFTSAYWAAKFVGQNGIGGFMTLAFLETIYGLHSILIDDYFQFDPKISTSIVLTLLAILLFCFFFVDTLLVERCLRFVIIPYCLIATFLCSTVLTKSDQNSWQNVIFIIGLVCCATLLTGVRVLVGLFYQRQTLM